MKVAVKKLPQSEVELAIEVAEKTIETARKETFRRFAQEVKIDGFRAGKAPEEKILEKVGQKTFEVEMFDLAIQLAYAEAVQREKLKVVARPKVEIENTAPLKFTARVAVLPEVRLGDYRKIKLVKEVAKVEPKEIEAVIADIAKGNSEARVIADRPARKGDRVEIDFTGSTPDGVLLEGARSKNHPLVLGEGNFVPGFEEGVAGMQTGEEKEHLVKFPTNYHAKHLAGADVKFKIKLHKIEELKPPTLDDEFAQKISGGQKKSWAEVKADIAEHLKSRKEVAAREKLENDLIAELLKIGKVEPPAILIDEEAEFMLKDLQQRLAGGGLEWEKYLEQSKKTEEEVRKELREGAEKRVKVRLLLDQLVEVEKIEVKDAEVAAEIERAAERHPESQKKDVRAAYAPGTPNRVRLQQQLKVIKLLGELIKTLSQ